MARSPVGTLASLGHTHMPPEVRVLTHVCFQTWIYFLFWTTLPWSHPEKEVGNSVPGSARSTVSTPCPRDNHTCLSNHTYLPRENKQIMLPPNTRQRSQHEQEPVNPPPKENTRFCMFPLPAS